MGNSESRSNNSSSGQFLPAEASSKGKAVDMDGRCARRAISKEAGLRGYNVEIGKVKERGMKVFVGALVFGFSGSHVSLCNGEVASLP